MARQIVLVGGFPGDPDRNVILERLRTRTGDAVEWGWLWADERSGYRPPVKELRKMLAQLEQAKKQRKPKANEIVVVKLVLLNMETANRLYQHCDPKLVPSDRYGLEETIEWLLSDDANLFSKGDVDSGVTEEEVRFDTVADAIAQAKEDFSGPLLFLPSAIDSANESPYENPDRVYEIFEGLYCVAEEWKKNDGKLGRTWKQAMAKYGDVRSGISQTTKGKWGDEYKFMYKGQKRLFETHITIGAKQPQKCLSIHWYRDDDDTVLVIGHCGRHLTNTKSR